MLSEKQAGRSLTLVVGVGAVAGIAAGIAAGRQISLGQPDRKFIALPRMDDPRAGIGGSVDRAAAAVNGVVADDAQSQFVIDRRQIHTADVGWEITAAAASIHFVIGMDGL